MIWFGIYWMAGAMLLALGLRDGEVMQTIDGFYIDHGATITTKAIVVLSLLVFTILWLPLFIIKAISY